MQKPPLAEAQSALGKQKIGSVEIGYLSRCRNSIKKLNMADGRHKKQEAQLSQRDVRSTLRVIEYFAKSLKLTQSHSK